jgi:hypothetical protein
MIPMGKAMRKTPGDCTTFYGILLLTAPDLALKEAGFP